MALALLPGHHFANTFKVLWTQLRKNKGGGGGRNRTERREKAETVMGDLERNTKNKKINFGSQDKKRHLLLDCVKSC